MLLKLLLIASILCFTAFDRLKGEELRDGSGDQPDDIGFGQEGNPDGADDVVETDDEASGGDITPVRHATVAINNREPPSPVDKGVEPDYKNLDEEEYGDDNHGAGIVFDDKEGEDVTGDTKHYQQEPVHVQENSLITHPGILAAIVVGGVLVLVCLIVFCVLVVCCVRKKDEGTYDLDDAMKQKLKYVAYTKAETSPDKEFFA